MQMRQPSPEKSIGKNDPEGRVVGEIPKKEAPETDNLPEINVVMVPKGTENVTREEVEKGMFNPSGRPGSGDSLEDTAEWPVHKPDEVDPDADTAEHPVPEAPAAPKETPGKAYKAGVFAGSILNRGRQAIDRILNQKEIEALRTRLKGALEDMGPCLGHKQGSRTYTRKHCSQI